MSNKLYYKEQYLNYLAIELLNMYGNTCPSEKEILEGEMLIKNFCDYLHSLVLKFLKTIGKTHPTKKQINHLGMLVAKYSKKYFFELSQYNRSKRVKMHYLRR